jgi:hypothetical protein
MLWAWIPCPGRKATLGMAGENMDCVNCCCMVDTGGMLRRGRWPPGWRAWESPGATCPVAVGAPGGTIGGGIGEGTDAVAIVAVSDDQDGKEGVGILCTKGAERERDREGEREKERRRETSRRSTATIVLCKHHSHYYRFSRKNTTKHVQYPSICYVVSIQARQKFHLSYIK